MKMRSVFLQLLREDERKEINEDTKSRICSFLSRNHPNSRTVNIYCCRLLLTKRHSDCHVQRLAGQHIYCTNTVQTVQSATELYIQ